MNTSEVDAQKLFHSAVLKFAEERPSRKTRAREWLRMEGH